MEIRVEEQIRISMFIQKEARRDVKGLSDLLDYFLLASDGVVLTSTGVYVAGWEFRGYSSLSQDDWMDAYVRGGDRAVNHYYMEQKREHGLSKKEALMPELGKDRFAASSIESLRNLLESDRAMERVAEIGVGLSTNTPEGTEEMRQLAAEVAAHKAAIEAEIASRENAAQVVQARPSAYDELVAIRNNEAGRIDRDWHNAKVQTTDEATAATNHYRGQATAFNKLREEVLQRHPEARQAVPQRLDVEQIRVQQNLVIEQELVQRGPALSTR